MCKDCDHRLGESAEALVKLATAQQTITAQAAEIAKWEESAANLLFKLKPDWTTMPSKPALTIGQIEQIAEEQAAEIERLRAEVAANTEEFDVLVINGVLTERVGELERQRDTLAEALRPLLDWLERYLKWTHHAISAGPPMDQDPRRDSHMLHQIREHAARAHTALREAGMEVAE